MGKKEVIKQRQVNHLFIHIIGIELVFYICSMMNKCLCENVFTLGATIETNAIYIYRYRDNIYIVVFTHQQQRTTKKKKRSQSCHIVQFIIFDSTAADHHIKDGKSSKERKNSYASRCS